MAGSILLDREEMRSYRSAIARCNYLAMDRLNCFHHEGALQGDVEAFGW